MILKSKEYQVCEVKKRTHAMWWRYIKPGDILQISLKMQNTSGASRGVYVNRYTVTRIRLGEHDSIANVPNNQLLNHLDRFVMREVQAGDE